MAEYASPSNIRWAGQGYGVAEFGSDDKLIVLFYTRPVENAAKSLAAGRKICENVDYVQIFHPGEGSTNKIDRPASENDKRRFPRQWDHYVHNRTQTPEGTPIDLLYPNNPAQAENLKAMGVFTVEQAANLSAHAQDRVGMGAQDIVNKANAFIQNANKGVNFHAQNEEIKRLKQENRLLQDNISKLRSQVDQLVHKMSNPRESSLTPPWTGTDEQVHRINANHPTREASKKKKVVKTEVEASPDIQLNLDNI